MDGSQKPYAKWKKPDTEAYMIPFMWHSRKYTTIGTEIRSGCQRLD